MQLWELSHYAKQHPTASTRSGLNSVNKLACTQLRMHFVVVTNQQLEIFMVMENNNQSIKAERSTCGHSFGDISDYKDETGSFMVASLLPVR
jgi:hypothetical protein